MGYNLKNLEKYLRWFFKKYPFEYLENRIEDILKELTLKNFKTIIIGGSGSTDVLRVILSFYNYDWYDFDIISLGNLSGSYYDYVVLIYKEMTGIDIEEVKKVRKSKLNIYEHEETLLKLDYHNERENQIKINLQNKAENFENVEDFEFSFNSYDYQEVCTFCEEEDVVEVDENGTFICGECSDKIIEMIEKMEEINK